MGNRSANAAAKAKQSTLDKTGCKKTTKEEKWKKMD